MRWTCAFYMWLYTQSTTLTFYVRAETTHSITIDSWRQWKIKKVSGKNQQTNRYNFHWSLYHFFQFIISLSFIKKKLFYSILYLLIDNYTISYICRSIFELVVNIVGVFCDCWTLVKCIRDVGGYSRSRRLPIYI